MEIAKGKTQVIASHHSEEAPPPANEIISEIEDYVSYGDMVKIYQFLDQRCSEDIEAHGS